ncbi:MAG: hypothetical protein ACK4NR_05285 [Micavibrio sp.]
MTINNRPANYLTRHFAERANPWAPKYEPVLWNDRSEGAFMTALSTHTDGLERALKAFDLREGTIGLSRLFGGYSDDVIAQQMNTDQDHVAGIRKTVFSFLNSTMFSTNCYAYALNVRDGLPAGAKLFPGSLADRHKDHIVEWDGDVDQIIEGAIKDGLRLFEGDPDHDKVPDAYYLVALHTRPAAKDQPHDFHFIRTDRHGGISHKNGHGYVTNLNSAGRDIMNLKAPVLPQYKYRASFLVPCVMTSPKI